MRRSMRAPNSVYTNKRVEPRSSKNKGLYYTLASSTVLDKASLSITSRELDNVFLAAAKYGDVDILLKTLDGEHNININVRDDTTGDTALILAAKNNNPQVVEMLVERGADPTILNEDGHNVLDHSSNHVKLAILSRYPSKMSSSNMQTCILKAVWQADLHSLRKMLNKNDKEQERYLNQTNTEGLTPLLVLTRDINIFLRLEQSIKLRYDPMKVLQELLRYKVDIDATDMEGRTALHFATRITTHKMCKEVVDLLLTCRPAIDVLDRTNISPLHTATNNNNLSVVTALLDAGADPDLHGIGGATALHIGAQHDNDHVIRVLLRGGSDANALDNAGMTPLCVSRSQRIRQLIRSLFLEINGNVKLKYDELAQRRRLKKMIKKDASVTDFANTEDTAVNTISSIKPLQRKFYKQCQESNSKYNYAMSQRVTSPPEVINSETTEKLNALLPKIDLERPPIVAARRRSKIEVPVLKRHDSRLKGSNEGSVVHHKFSCATKERPPIPKHTCGYNENRSKSRQNSARRSDRKISVTSENEVWLPGAPKIMDTNSSRTSTPNTSSKSDKTNKIHLKEVLKSTLMSANTDTDDLMARYIKQQKPVKVKELGFIDFLLQDIDPDKMSETSFSGYSCAFSDVSSLSNSTLSREGGNDVGTVRPLVALKRVSIGEASTPSELTSLPTIRQPVAQHSLNGFSSRRLSKEPAVTFTRQTSKPKPKKPRKSLTSASSRPNNGLYVTSVQLEPNSETLLPPNYRSSKDSGYGSMNALECKDSVSPLSAMRTKPPATGGVPETGDGVPPQRTDMDPLATACSRDDSPPPPPSPDPAALPPKYITSVVVNHELGSEDVVDGFSRDEGGIRDSDKGTKEESYSDKNHNGSDILDEEQNTQEADYCQNDDKELNKEDDKEPEELSKEDFELNELSLIKGVHIKPINMKNKEASEFRKRIYNQRLPEIREEFRSRDVKHDRDRILFTPQLKKQKSEAKVRTSGKTSTSEVPNTTTKKENQVMTITGIKKSEKIKGKSNLADMPSEREQSPSGSDTPVDAVEVDPEDATIIKKLSRVKNFDELISSTPLQVEIAGAPFQHPEPPESKSPKDAPDSRSVWSERRSILTDFTGTTKIESIMGETTQWKRGKLLGHGASGKVWYGVTSEAVEVAVKQIELTYDDLSEAKDDFRKLQEEVRLLKCLKHDHIVRYYGTCIQDNHVNIFMEYVRGSSLAGRIKREKMLPEPLIQKITYQIVSALQYIHAKNIVHRDIKGQNILISDSNVVKLIDFGCSKRLRRSLMHKNELKTFRGTPYWMSPEVIKETGHGVKSDIWSLSCTVFEMLTGNPPWYSYPAMAAMYKIGTGKAVPSYPDYASGACVSFMKSCFILDPKERLSAEELLEHSFLNTN